MGSKHEQPGGWDELHSLHKPYVARADCTLDAGRKGGAARETRYLHNGPGMSSAEYADVNPMRKVPAIVHDGMVVTECAAICLYLADAFPKADLAPPLDAQAG